MSFLPPVYNIVCDTWNATHVPMTDPADFTNVPCQLYVNSRALLDITPASQSEWVPPIFVRVDPSSWGSVKDAWIFSVDTGHGTQYFKARWKEFIHLGFSNEYVEILVEQCDNAGNVPYYFQVTY